MLPLAATISAGDVLRASGDIGSAALRYREALVLGQQIGDNLVTTACLQRFCGLSVDFGRHEVAARLFGVAQAIRETVGRSASRYEEERLRVDMAIVREALGREVDRKARETGKSSPRDSAVEEALTLADTLVATINMPDRHEP